MSEAATESPNLQVMYPVDGAVRVAALPRNVALLSAGRFVALVSQIPLLAMLVRVLGVSEYGYFALAMSIGSIGGAFMEGGLNHLTLREIAIYPRRTLFVLKAGVVTRLILGGLVTVVAVGLVWRHYPHILVVPVALALIAALLRIFLEFSCAFLNALGRIVWSAFGWALQGGSLLLACALAAWLGARSAGSMLLAWVLAAACVASFFFVLVLRDRSFGVADAPKESWLAFFRRSLPFAALPIVATLWSAADPILISLFKPAYQVGFYQAGQKLVLTLESFPFMASVAALPILSRVYHESGKDFGRWSSVYVRFMLLLAFPIALVLALFAPVIVRILYGQEFAMASQVLRILGLAVPFLMANWSLGTILTAIGHQATRSWILCAGIALQVGLNLLLLPRFEFVAAAWVALCVSALVALSMFCAVVVTCDKTQRFVAILWPCVAGLAMAVLALGLIGRGSLVAAGAGFLGYLIVLGVLRQFDPCEIRWVLRSLLDE